MEDNIMLIQEMIPELNDYRMAGNSRLVARDAEPRSNRGRDGRRTGRSGYRSSSRGRGNYDRGANGRNRQQDDSVYDNDYDYAGRSQQNQCGRGGGRQRGRGGPGRSARRHDESRDRGSGVDMSPGSRRYDDDFPEMNNE